LGGAGRGYLGASADGRGASDGGGVRALGMRWFGEAVMTKSTFINALKIDGLAGDN
jgi:hypothetical protein